MRLESLSVFLSVARHRSFSEAARYEHLTQPAVTACIKNMESTYGVVLFRRVSGQKKPLELTEEGKIIEKYATEIIHLNALMEHDLASVVEEERVFSIGSGKSTGIFVLPRLMQAFSRKHRGARYTVRTCTDSGVLVRMLAEKQVDLGITVFSPKEEMFEARQFLSDPFTLACPVAAAIPDPISAEEFVKCPLIVRENGCNSYQKVAEGLKSIGVSMSDLNTVMTVYDNAALYYAIRNGIGYGFIPKSLLLDESVSRPVVKPVHVKRFKAVQKLYLVRLKDTSMTPDMRLLWEFIQSKSWREVQEEEMEM